MSPTPLPSKAYLHARFQYDKDSGKLFWKRRKQTKNADRFTLAWNTRYAGKEAGCLSFDKFNKPRAVVVQLLFPDGKKRLMYAHRIILKLLSKLPEERLEVDHIDGNPFNNRADNLRICLHIENSQNLGESVRRKRSAASSSLPMGVRLKRGKFSSEIRMKLNGKRISFFPRLLPHCARSSSRLPQSIL